MRYILQEKLFSLGDDYVIRDEEGREAFRVDGKVLTLRDTLILEDPEGNRRARIRKKLLSIGKTYVIDRDGAPDVTVHKNLFSPLRCTFQVDVEGGELEARGNLLDHEYTVTRDGQEIATITKKWLTVRDTYGIEIADGEDPALILACAVAIDRMCHEEEEPE